MTRKRLFTPLLDPNRPRLVALIAFCSIMAISFGCAALRNVRGYRYCEILLSYDDTSEVWGTQGLNQCPNEQWEALVPETIRAEYNATGIIMNGPRYFVINGASGVDMPKGNTRIYGELEMRRLATLNASESEPYVPATVLRTNTWEFHEGSEIYELTDPEGQVYTMQSYSQIIDPSLQEADLSTLGNRLNLPQGWRFSAFTLDAPLELVADGEAVVVVDELRNTYQKR